MTNENPKAAVYTQIADRSVVIGARRRPAQAKDIVTLPTRTSDLAKFPRPSKPLHRPARTLLSKAPPHGG